MPYALLADVVMVAHGLFVVFVVAGAVLVLRWPRIAWIHLPLAAWGAWVELGNRVCPLTPLENDLRRRAGEAGYQGGFLERYLVDLVYPPGLTREVQVGLGVGVIVLNAAIYAWVWRRRRRMAHRLHSDDDRP
jgi:hypothetical protein